MNSARPGYTGLVPSVVIPAHNEATTLPRLLRALLHDARPDEFEIVVVANGCSDATANAARAFPVQVIELDPASKAAALRAGDDATHTFPRAYIDADVVVDTDALRATFAALDRPEVLCAAPSLDLRTEYSTGLVRCALRAWQAVPWRTEAPVGSGCYAVSALGHTHIAPFPDLIADDAYVATSFTTAERHTVADHTFTAFAPRTLRALIARRRRVQHGNHQLATLEPDRAARLPHTTPGQMAQIGLESPSLVPGLLTLAAVNLAARRGATDDDWEQDATSRVDVEPEQPTSHRSRTARDRVANVFRSYLNPALYLHLLRLAHFVGYTHVQERKALQLGRNVRFSPTTSLRNGARIAIGDDSAIGEYSSLWAGDASARITIGKRTLLGPSVFITASDYGTVAGTPFREQPKREADVVVGDDVWLGTRVIVTAGVTIGDGCIVGAGAVVTKSLPPNSIAAGVPARVISTRATDEQAPSPESIEKANVWALTSPSSS